MEATKQMLVEELKLGRMKELTRKLNPSTMEVDPSRFFRTCTIKYQEQQDNWLEPWSTQWGLALCSPMPELVSGKKRCQSMKTTRYLFFRT